VLHTTDNRIRAVVGVETLTETGIKLKGVTEKENEKLLKGNKQL
jgi:hypothetical protein